MTEPKPKQPAYPVAKPLTPIQRAEIQRIVEIAEGSHDDYEGLHYALRCHFFWEEQREVKLHKYEPSCETPEGG